MGSGLSFPPLFLMQIMGMSLTGVVGGMVKPIFFKKEFTFVLLFCLGIIGFFTTLIYDVLTLVSYPLSAGLGLSGILAALIKGIGFTVLHEVSNAVIFVVAVPSVVKYLK